MSSSIFSNMHTRTEAAYMRPRRFPARALIFLGLLGLSVGLAAQPAGRIRPRDRSRDILLTTTQGELRLRLSDATPLHRDNFIRLVRSGFYRGVLFHRVIQGFMVQAGDPRTRPTGTKGLGRSGGDKPLTEVRILRAKMVRRK